MSLCSLKEDRAGQRQNLNSDLKAKAIVTKTLPCRSHYLRTAAGRIVRRSSRSLRHSLPIYINNPQAQAV